MQRNRKCVEMHTDGGIGLGVRVCGIGLGHGERVTVWTSAHTPWRCTLMEVWGWGLEFGIGVGVGVRAAVGLGLGLGFTCDVYCNVMESPWLQIAELVGLMMLMLAGGYSVGSRMEKVMGSVVRVPYSADRYSW